MLEIYDQDNVALCPFCDYRLTLVGYYENALKEGKGYYWCKKCDNEISEEDIDAERSKKN